MGERFLNREVLCTHAALTSGQAGVEAPRRAQVPALLHPHLLWSPLVEPNPSPGSQKAFRINNE